MDLRTLPALLIALVALSGCLGDDGGDEDAPSQETSEDGTKQTVVLNRAEYSGTLPPQDPQSPTVAHHPFDVPDNATRIVVWYNTTYNGLFSSLLALEDSEDERVRYGIDDCPDPAFQPEAGATYQCELKVSKGLKPGEWDMILYYQAGEATEEYTLEAVVYGKA